MDYPIWDPSIGPGMLMATVAIAHVIVSHFAIGGGLILAVSETIAVRRDDEQLRALVKRSSLVLILVSPSSAPSPASVSGSSPASSRRQRSPH